MRISGCLLRSMSGPGPRWDGACQARAVAGGGGEGAHRVLLTVCVSKAYATRASMAGTTACATRPSLYTTKHGPSGSVPRSRGSVNHDTSATLFSLGGSQRRGSVAA